MRFWFLAGERARVEYLIVPKHLKACESQHGLFTSHAVMAQKQQRPTALSTQGSRLVGRLGLVCRRKCAFALQEVFPSCGLCPGLHTLCRQPLNWLFRTHDLETRVSGRNVVCGSSCDGSAWSR